MLTVTIVEIHILILEVCLINKVKLLLPNKFQTYFRLILKLLDLKLCIS